MDEWKDGSNKQEMGRPGGKKTKEKKKEGKNKKGKDNYLHHELPSFTVMEGCARPRLW